MNRVGYLLLLVAIAFASMPDADGRAIRRKVAEDKMTFESIRKAWEKGKIDKIVKLLPPKGKVRLEVRGVKRGSYRKEQAHALLKKYFGAIKTISFKKLKGADGLTTKYEHVYRLRANQKKETHKTHITLGREENRWVIVEIIEY
jgi:Domain of unknown function (DUF4783)